MKQLLETWKTPDSPGSEGHAGVNGAKKQKHFNEPRLQMAIYGRLCAFSN